MDKYEERAQRRRGHEDGGSDGVRSTELELGGWGRWDGSTGVRTTSSQIRLDLVGIFGT
jgi:hypothetical protein